MKKLCVNKIEAARRQIDAAIRILFDGEDDFAIHSIVAAAARILRDIAEKKGNCQFHEETTSSLRPGMEKEFWATINKPANFLKHADSDPDDTLEVNEEINESMILFCCFYYKDLGFQSTMEMDVFMRWITIVHPELCFFESSSSLNSTGWKNQPRKKRLAFGKEMLVHANRVNRD